MKLTNIAATGGVGREPPEQAVAAGHDVTAVVRNPAKLSRPVRTVAADMAAADPAALEAAVAGAGKQQHHRPGNQQGQRDDFAGGEMPGPLVVAVVGCILLGK